MSDFNTDQVIDTNNNENNAQPVREEVTDTGVSTDQWVETLLFTWFFDQELQELTISRFQLQNMYV